jgi:hypothetical protein
MNKRVIAFLSILSLFLSTPLIPANAVAKAGAKCAKAGNIEVVKGKTYTCIKSGKKLVWNKGVTSKKVGAAQPTLPTPTSFDDLVQNYEGIAYAAWSKSRTKIIASTKTDVNFKLVLGPNSVLTNKNPIDAINLVSRLYSGYAKSVDYYLLAFSYEDRDWAVKQMDSIIPTAGSRWIYDVACATKSTCFGGGSFTDSSNKHLMVLTVGLIDDNTTTGTLEAHEFAHSVQQMTMGAARPPVEFLTAPWFPNWYWEGQANFSQNAAIWFDSFDKYMSQRRQVSGGLFNASIYDSKYIESYFVLNPNKEWGAKHERYRQYDLGAMFIEILTALKGPDSTMEMWRLAGTGASLESAFEKVYGISFAKALPIMSKAIALELGRS